MSRLLERSRFSRKQDATAEIFQKKIQNTSMNAVAYTLIV